MPLTPGNILVSRSRSALLNSQNQYVFPGKVNAALADAMASSWANATVSVDRNWYAVVWAREQGKFVKVGRTGTERAAYSLDGKTWTLSAGSSSVVWEDVCYSTELDQYVRVGQSAISYSADGITWFNATSPAAEKWQRIIWVKELALYVTCGASVVTSTRIATSPDGINWITQTTPATAHTWRALAWSESLERIVCLGTGAADPVMTSTDGFTWVQGTGPNIAASDCCWSPELELFVGVSGAVLPSLVGRHFMWSLDGLSWNPSANGPELDAVWRRVRWCKGLGLFVALSTGAGGACLATSADGKNWVGDTTLAVLDWGGLEWSEELGILVATNTNDTVSWAYYTEAPAMWEASGFYPLTLSNGANVASSSTFGRASWSRNGDTVTCFGRFTITPTAPGILTTFGIKLPVSTNIVNSWDCAGVFNSHDTVSVSGAIFGDTTNEHAACQYVPPVITPQSIRFVLTYRVRV